MGLSDRLLVMAAIGSLLALIPWFLDHGVSVGVHQAPVVGKVFPEKSVRRRHSKNLLWEEVRESSDVYLRDILYTPPDERVEVVLNNGQRAWLPPDSMIQLDEVTLDNLQIALRERQEPPKERLLPLPRRSRVGELNDPMNLAYELETLSRRLASYRPRELPALRAPNLQSLADAPKMESLRDFEVRLIRPIGGEAFNQGKTQWITMKWTAIPLQGVTYELQVSRNNVFSPLVTYQTRADELSIQVEDSGGYYWRVAAQHKGRSILSDSGTFTLVASRVDPSQTVSASLAGYALELARDSKFRSIVRTSVAQTAECSRNGLAPGKYFCRASPVDGISSVHEYSFEVK